LTSVRVAPNELHVVGQGGPIFEVATHGTRCQSHNCHRRSHSCLSPTFGCSLGKVGSFFAYIAGSLPRDLIQRKIRPPVTSLSMSNLSNNARPSLHLKLGQGKPICHIRCTSSSLLDELGSFPVLLKLVWFAIFLHRGSPFRLNQGLPNNDDIVTNVRRWAC